MRKLITALIVVFIFVVSVRAEIIRGRVIWIHDGDTVTITAANGSWFKLRLWGIDSPELDQPGGRESMLFLIRSVGRKTVDIDVRDTDHYGRMVGIILYKNRDICREMILNGHAWHYVQYAPKQKNYAEAEQHARKNKLGIWSGKQKSPVPPWEWRKMKRKKTGTQ